MPPYSVGGRVPGGPALGKYRTGCMFSLSEPVKPALGSIVTHQHTHLSERSRGARRQRLTSAAPRQGSVFKSFRAARKAGCVAGRANPSHTKNYRGAVRLPPDPESLPRSRRNNASSSATRASAAARAAASCARRVSAACRASRSRSRASSVSSRFGRSCPVCGSWKRSPRSVSRNSSPSTPLASASVPSASSRPGSPRYSPALSSRPCSGGSRIVARRVVLPVLLHAQRKVQLALAALVFAVRRARGNLQHEVGPLALFPQPVAGTVGVGHAQHHEHVGRHRRTRVPLLVVEQQVAGHVHVPAAAKVVPQPVHAGSECRTLRVTTVRPCSSAVAAMSRSALSWPRRPDRRPHRRAAGKSAAGALQMIVVLGLVFGIGSSRVVRGAVVGSSPGMAIQASGCRGDHGDGLLDQGSCRR